MAYRSFRPSGFEARGVRKVTKPWLALKPSVRLRLVMCTTVILDSAMLAMHPNCGKALKLKATKHLKPIQVWPHRDCGGNNALRCNNG